MRTKVIKGFLFALFAISATVSSYAQAYLEDPKYGADKEAREKCVVNSSLYGEYYKQGNFKDAFGPWNIVLTVCPASSQNTYIRGARILKYYIETAPDPVTKNAYIDSLMSLYDRRIQYFNRKGYVLGQKATDLLALNPDRFEEAYNMVKEAISIDKVKSESSVVYSYMVLAKTMYDNQKLQAEEVIEIYSQSVELIENQIKANPNDDKLTQIKDGIDAVFASANVANCDNLVALFTPRFTENANDLDLCKKIVALMGANGCTNLELYRLAGTNVFAVEPTADLAYELAKLNSSIGQFKKAEEYFNKAIELESEIVKRSVYFLEYATIVAREFNNPQQARSLALKALEVNPNLGHAYIFIGNLYAAEKNCGADDFDKKTVFWAACDKYIQAKRVDPSLANQVDQLLSSYSQYFPAKNDIFFHDLNTGDAYTVGCWINERTTVRDK
ncbi:MAG: hypothetical protein JW783_07030 [Bacteroidales bacterium]|nr:hypothetical protein [Bacteroidales bacterium]MBN2750878.1 hypothetical protein [Bacteroidales bacterium]